MSLVTSAINHIGLCRLAENVGKYPSGVSKWRDTGRLPRTELAGLTNYAEVMETLSDGRFTASALIEETRRQWKRRLRERDEARAS